MRTNTCRRVAQLALLAGLLLGPAQLAIADVKLPALFSDHAVLQQGVAVPVWGRAEPGEGVTVTLGSQTKTAKAGADGKWKVQLDKLQPGGPLTLTAKGKNTLTVQDVLVGEVWLGSGQSNMAMSVKSAKDFQQEQAAANLPQVRMFIVKSGASAKAEEDCAGAWYICSPDTVGSFSATLFFCGREIHKALGLPVGLINSSVGGTPIESWISPDAQKQSPELKAFFETKKKAEAAFDAAAAKAQYEKSLVKWNEAVARAKAAKKPIPRKPRDPLATRERKGDVGGLFNGKIAPLIPYAIRGAVWYQGEANAQPSKAEFYQYQLPLLVQDWRSRWGYEFPLAWVQLPNFTRPGDYWPVVREGMLKSLKTPNTGMAIAIDIGDPKNIHPANKQEVGRRLSLWALGTVYGRNVPATSGPLPAGHKIAGSTVVCSFTHADGGLVAQGGALKGFAIAGADKKWLPANAKIAGDTVVVSHPEVKQPAAVRYAWAENPECNLYNGAGLPASPFRTDDWPISP